MLCAHIGEKGTGERIFCQDQKAGGVPVKAVDAAEDEFFPLFLVMERQSIGKRVAMIVDRGVDGHIGRLVDYQKIRILIGDGKGKLYRRDRGESFLGKMYRDPVPFLQDGGSKPDFSVQENGIRLFFQLSQNMAGIPVRSQKGEEGVPIFFGCDLIFENSFHSECYYSMDVPKGAMVKKDEKFLPFPHVLR